MSTHSVSAMTGLKLPKRRAKSKVTEHLVAANEHLAAVNKALTQTKTVSALDLANALIGNKAPSSPRKLSPSGKPSPKSSGQGAISAKGWHPAKISDAPDTFQGKAGTAK